MLKSLDWANATAEKRARAKTSLDCIFDLGVIWVKEREELWRDNGKRVYEKRELDGEDVKGRKPIAKMEFWYIG